MSTQNSTLSVATQEQCPQLAPHQFQPGKSGNPGGRPKRKPFLEAIEKWIMENPEDVTKAIKRAFASARGGSLMHLRELMDRVDGPVKQEVELSGKVELAAALEGARRRAAEEK